jgi:hypothetical protein
LDQAVWTRRRRRGHPRMKTLRTIGSTWLERHVEFLNSCSHVGRRLSFHPSLFDFSSIHRRPTNDEDRGPHLLGRPGMKEEGSTSNNMWLPAVAVWVPGVVAFIFFFFVVVMAHFCFRSLGCPTQLWIVVEQSNCPKTCLVP